VRQLVVLGSVLAAGVVGYGLGRRAGPEEQAAPYHTEPAEFARGSARVADLRELAKGANLVICVMDAARADHCGCYGYPRETTPHLDRLARESLVFEMHFTQFSATRQSTASLFLSQYPDTHLVFDERAMCPWTFTLAEGLRRGGGFETVMLSNNVYCSPAMGLGSDFDEVYAVTTIPRVMAEGPRSLLDKFESWLEKGRESRFFAYVHLLPPHYPYNAPEEMKALFAGREPPNRRERDKGQVNLYDANLRYADWAVGELERLLREAGVLDKTILVVTADHGEAFSEHGEKWHATCPYEEVTHIPLVVRFPGGEEAVGRVRSLTQVIDIMPTLFDLFEIPYPDDLQGRSLLPVLAGDVERVNDYVFCRAKGETPRYMVRSEDWALVLRQGSTERELYDMKSDPGQTRNVIEERPEEAAQLVKAFWEFAQRQRCKPLDFLDPDEETAELPAAPRREIADETRKQLEALGYLREAAKESASSP